MKKLLSIFLSILMISGSVSCVDFSAMADECEHSWFCTRTVAPSCNTDGYDVYVCDKCDASEQRNIVAATGKHNYVNGVCKKCKAVDESYERVITPMALGGECSLSFSSEDEEKYFSFTPEATGYYDFQQSQIRVAELYITNAETGKTVTHFTIDPGESGRAATYLTKDVNYLLTLSIIVDYAKQSETVFTVTEHSHKISTTVVRSNTCTSEGLERQSCSLCGKMEEVVTPVNPSAHSSSVGIVCSRCNGFKPYESISADDVITVPSMKKGEASYYAFTPDADGLYQVFTSCVSNIVLPIVYDENGNVIDDAFYQEKLDHSGSPSLFSTTATNELEGGKTYYIGIYANENINGSDNTFGVRAHTHNIYTAVTKEVSCISDGYKVYRCSGCEYNEKLDVVPATGEHNYENGICTVCNTLNPDEIRNAVLALDEEATLTTQRSGETVYFHFTADKTDYYTFNADSDGNATFYLSKASNPHTVNKVFNNGTTVVKLTAGTEYVVSARLSSSAIGDISLTVSEHSHSLYLRSTTEASCKTNGSYNYACEQCDYTYNESIPMSADAHWFVNGKCAKCGAADNDYVKVTTPMTLDEHYTAQKRYGGEEYSYSFKSAESAYYKVCISKDTMGSIKLTDESGNQLASYSGAIGTGALNIIFLGEGRTINITLTLYSNSVTDNEIWVERHIHSFTDSTVNPTCDGSGYELHSCKACGYSYKDNWVSPTGEHVFEATVIAPTCSTPGLTTYTCKGCGIGYACDYVEADSDAHSYKECICEICGKLCVNNYLGELTPDEATAVSLSSSEDYKVLSFTPDKDGDYFIMSKGSYDTMAVLYDDAYNMVSFGIDISSGNYNFGIFEELEAGRTYYILVVAEIYENGMSFDVVAGEHSHSYGKHTVKATCGEYGYTAYTCICGAARYVNYVSPTGEHSWKKDEIVKPTCSENGYTLYYCTKCYEMKQENITEPTGAHNYVDGFCTSCDKREHEQTEISLGEITTDSKMTVENASLDNVYIFSFTATEKGTYLFSTTGFCDTYASLLSSDGKLISKDDDGGVDNNAQLAFDAEPGESFTFRIELFEVNNNDFSVSLTEHTHDFAKLIIPETCGTQGVTLFTCKDCFFTTVGDIIEPNGNHDFDENGLCKSCNQADKDREFDEIKLDEIKTVSAESYGIFRFRADVSCAYQITSFGAFEPELTIIDENGTTIDDYELSYIGMNFRYDVKLEKDKTYYFIASKELGDYRISVSMAHSHNMVEVESVPADCENDGYIRTACSVCGFEERTVLPRLEHSFTRVTKNSGCDKDGYIKDICTSCGYEKLIKTIPSTHGHNYEAVNVYEATCYAGGYTVYRCSYCGDEYTADETPRMQHKYYISEEPASCTEKGCKVRLCENCDYRSVISETDKTAHSWKDAKVIKKATLTANGSVKRVCTSCGTEKTFTVYSAKSFTLSAKSYTYNGKAKKPTVTIKDSKGNKIAASNYTVKYTSNKNVGKASVKITFKGRYSGAKTLFFTINPKGTTISSLTAGKKKLTVKVKKQTTQTTGYQIQYATNSKFTSAKSVTVGSKTTSKTVSGLKAKQKYFVRVRTYKTVNGTKYYSTWSKSKTVTTK